MFYKLALDPLTAIGYIIYMTDTKYSIRQLQDGVLWSGKIERATLERLRAVAAERKVSQSELVRACIGFVLNGEYLDLALRRANGDA